MREIKFRVRDNLYETMILDASRGPDIYGPNGYIMQYTGLKDKHGKDIYEGDIVRVLDDKTPYEVVFQNGGRAYTDGEVLHHELRHYSGYEVVEVIGNIYVNPELSKKLPSQYTK